MKISIFLDITIVKKYTINGNHTKGQICAKFDVPTHHHCQEIHNNKYYMGLLLVAMATIEGDSVESQGLWL